MTAGQSLPNAVGINELHLKFAKSAQVVYNIRKTYEGVEDGKYSQYHGRAGSHPR